MVGFESSQSDILFHNGQLEYIHKHPIICDLIDDSGHRVVYRAPYWSCDGCEATNGRYNQQ
jgi:hypothetical protein